MNNKRLKFLSPAIQTRLKKAAVVSLSVIATSSSSGYLITQVVSNDIGWIKKELDKNHTHSMDISDRNYNQITDLKDMTEDLEDNIDDLENKIEDNAEDLKKIRKEI